MSHLHSKILLDTCAAIWTSEGEAITKTAARAIEDASAAAQTILVSPITAWERGMLASKGRLTSPLAPKAWFDRLLSMPMIELSPLTVDVLTDCSFLPGSIHADPADRIIIATARQHGLRIMTRDRKILDYADAGHVNAIAC